MSTFPLTPGLFGTQMRARDVHALIYKNGWKEPLNMARMVATVYAESNGYSKAVGQVNANGTQDLGMFQLNSGHWHDYAASLDDFILIAFDPEKAAPIARALFDKDKKAGGTGFGPWFAYGTDNMKSFLPLACTSLANFTAISLGLQPLF
jgi:hypothetical protein